MLFSYVFMARYAQAFSCSNGFSGLGLRLEVDLLGGEREITREPLAWVCRAWNRVTCGCSPLPSDSILQLHWGVGVWIAQVMSSKDICTLWVFVATMRAWSRERCGKGCGRANIIGSAARPTMHMVICTYDIWIYAGNIYNIAIVHLFVERACFSLLVCPSPFSVLFPLSLSLYIEVWN